jgi:hypothetical protein
MTLGLVMLALYGAIGLAFVFVGLAARLLRRERGRPAWQADDRPRWKHAAFAGATLLGILVLWPVLVSAARTEAAAKAGPPDPRPAGPSAELDRWMARIRENPAKSLSFAAYRKIVDKLPWTDREHLDEQLARLGVMITGYVKDAQGNAVPATVRVLEVGSPFTLIASRGRAGSLPTPPALAAGEISADPLRHGLSFRLPVRPDDEVWVFSSSPDTWRHLAGRAGLALIREGTVIDAYVTRMN